MQQLIAFLNQPFPEQEEIGKNIKSLAGIGLFISLFLFLFRPFGLSEADSNLFLICLGFGAITFSFGVAFELFVRYILKIRTDQKNWTFLKWLISTAVLIVWIAIGNYLYINLLAGWNGWNFFGLSRMVLYTLMIGIFPIVFSGLTIQRKADKLNRNSAEIIQQKLEEIPSKAASSMLTFTLNSTEELSLDAAQVLYLEVVHNSVFLNYEENSSCKEAKMRSTISRLETEIHSNQIIRCHRSFMVNLNQIEHVEGNAQGLKLKLKHLEKKEIPVSRSYIPFFRKKFT